jgi:hypothetical protein
MWSADQLKRAKQIHSHLDKEMPAHLMWCGCMMMWRCRRTWCDWLGCKFYRHPGGSVVNFTFDVIWWSTEESEADPLAFGQRDAGALDVRGFWFLFFLHLDGEMPAHLMWGGEEVKGWRSLGRGSKINRTGWRGMLERKSRGRTTLDSEENPHAFFEFGQWVWNGAFALKILCFGVNSRGYARGYARRYKEYVGRGDLGLLGI